MILHIARKEMTEMVRDGRFRISGAILFTLLAGALLLGWQHYVQVSAQHAAARSATREQWLNQGKKNPHSAAHYGIYAFKPKAPLSLLDPGTDPYTGVAVWLEAHKQNEFKYRPAHDATAVQRFGELTGATVMQLLVPLLIVLLTFNAFSSERELGTLRQLLSLGVNRAHLAAGKALGVCLALSLLLVPAAAIGAFAITTASGSIEMLAALPRAAGLTLSYLLYFGVFIATSLAVSAWASSSRAALIGLLAFWMVNTLIAPRAASDIAKALRPTPSAFEFTHNMERALAEGAETRIKLLETELLRKYNVDSIESLPVNFNGIRLQEGENHGNHVFDQAYAELWRTFSQQDTVHRVLAVLMPGLAARSLSMAFAGTDFPQHAHFATAAEQHRRLIQRVMNDDLMRNASNTGSYFAGNALWSKVPPFEYTAPDARWVASLYASTLAILALWVVAASIAALFAARRVQVY